MIVRTYGRRSRSFSDGSGGGGERGLSSSQYAFEFDDDNDGDGGGDELVVLGSQPFPPSQESSSMWDFDEDPPTQLLPPPLRLEGGPRRKGRRGRGGGGEYTEPAAATATPMEAEEYGEMMESVDKVNFVLDGLRTTTPLPRAAVSSGPRGQYAK